MVAEFNASAKERLRRRPSEAASSRRAGRGDAWKGGSLDRPVGGGGGVITAPRLGGRVAPPRPPVIFPSVKLRVLTCPQMSFVVHVYVCMLYVLTSRFMITGVKMMVTVTLQGREEGRVSPLLASGPGKTEGYLCSKNPS